MRIFDAVDRKQFDEAVRQVKEWAENRHKKPEPASPPERQISNLEKICTRGVEYKE